MRHGHIIIQSLLNAMLGILTKICLLLLLNLYHWSVLCDPLFSLQPSDPTGSRNFSTSSSVVSRTFQTLTRQFKLGASPESTDSSSSSLAYGDAVDCGNGVVFNVRRYASQAGKDRHNQGSRSRQ